MSELAWASFGTIDRPEAASVSVCQLPRGDTVLGGEFIVFGEPRHHTNPPTERASVASNDLVNWCALARYKVFVLAFGRILSPLPNSVDWLAAAR